MTTYTDRQKACPFCGSTDISEGEVLTALPNNRTATQSMCRQCGALGPEAILPHGEVDFGCEKASEAWNRRAVVATFSARPLWYVKQVHANHMPEFNSIDEFSDGMGGGTALYALESTSSIADRDAVLYEHEDGRYAVAPSDESATFTSGDPKWHRVGPVTLCGFASPVAGFSEATKTADQLYAAIEQVLLHYRHSTIRTEDGDSGYPLTDLLTMDGHSIQMGYDEIRYICDAIYNEVLTKSATSQPAAPDDSQVGLDCLEKLRALMVRLGVSPGEGGMEAFSAKIESNLYWTIRAANSLLDSLVAAPADDETDYAALEREHLGDPDKRTGIYAPREVSPSTAAQGATVRTDPNQPWTWQHCVNYPREAAALLNARAAGSKSDCGCETNEPCAMKKDGSCWRAD
jgi:Lar family restriction alleviation protein